MNIYFRLIILVLIFLYMASGVAFGLKYNSILNANRVVDEENSLLLTAHTLTMSIKDNGFLGFTNTSTMFDVFDVFGLESMGIDAFENSISTTLGITDRIITFDESIKNIKYQGNMTLNDLRNSGLAPKVVGVGYKINLTTDEANAHGKEVIQEIKDTFDQLGIELSDNVNCGPLSVGDVLGPQYGYYDEKTNETISVCSYSKEATGGIPYVEVNYKFPFNADQIAAENNIETSEMSLGSTRVFVTKAFGSHFLGKKMSSELKLLTLDVYIDNKNIQTEKIEFDGNSYVSDVSLVMTANNGHPLIVVKSGCKGTQPDFCYTYYFNSNLNRFVKIDLPSFDVVNSTTSNSKLLVFSDTFMASDFSRSELIDIPVMMILENGKFTNVTAKHRKLIGQAGKVFLDKFKKQSSSSYNTLYAYMICQYILSNKNEAWVKFNTFYKKGDKKKRMVTLRQDINRFILKYNKYNPVNGM